VRTAVARWQDWVSFAAGLWLALSPWICGYADEQPAATGNAAFMGIALAITAHFQASLDARSARWLHFAAGAWLAVAPFVLAFGEALIPALNCIAVGTLLMALATFSPDKDLGKWKWRHGSSSRVDL